VNPRSGRGLPTTEELVGSARALGIATHVLEPGDEVAGVARAADADVLGVAGGDGSLAEVASAAIDLGVPFVCVPFGTRNHFARDLGLDRDDPLGALDAFEGIERRVDVGRVNGRLFPNNVSLGLYAGLVRRREHHRRRGEALAGARALWLIAIQRHRLRAVVDGETVPARILLVANNPYELRLFTLGRRTSLTSGLLHLYSADGWLPRSWLERSAPRYRIEVGRAAVPAAIDGEPLTLGRVLELESCPRALRMLLPRGLAGG
jgi:diacylglycerol kinase family enzyme